MNRYLIYDANTGLFAEDVVVIAKNSADAVRKYMKNTGITGTIKRSADSNVRFKAIRTIEKNGKIYRSGNDIWYKLYNQEA